MTSENRECREQQIASWERCFRMLSKAFAQQAGKGHVYLVGGRAIVQGFPRRRWSASIDVLLVEGEPIARAAFEAMNGGQAMDEAPAWLADIACWVAEEEPWVGRPVYGDEYLTVTGMAAGSVLALKLRQVGGLDREGSGFERDVAALLHWLQVNTLAEAWAMHDRMFPEDALDERVRELGTSLLERCLAAGHPVRFQRTLLTRQEQELEDRVGVPTADGTVAGEDPDLGTNGRTWPLRWEVAEYTRPMEEGWGASDCYRFLISQMPRYFHGSTLEERVHALRRPPTLTHTCWDALLAAVTEHVCLTHRHPVPEWCHEAERTLDSVWVPTGWKGRPFPGIHFRDMAGAFLRHGVVVGSWDMGEREGERPYGLVLLP